MSLETKYYPFRIAVENGHLDVVKFLVDQGSDIHADDDYAFYKSKDNGYTEIVEFLQSFKKTEK